MPNDKPTPPTERTTVGEHPGSAMQAHVPLDLLKAIGVCPGDELEWYYTSDQPVAIVRNPDA